MSDQQSFDKLKKECDKMYYQYMELKDKYEELHDDHDELIKRYNKLKEDLSVLRKQIATHHYSKDQPQDKYEHRAKRQKTLMQNVNFKRYTKTHLAKLARKYGFYNASRFSKEELCNVLNEFYHKLPREEKDIMNSVCATITG
jgi:5'(3')-deoxyribonucleotidase